MADITKEKWSKGPLGGTVISDTPNRLGPDTDAIEYYGGHLVAESIPKQEYVNLIARAPSMLALLEKAYPIIEEEAERRDNAYRGAEFSPGSYWREMAELRDAISAEIDRARGKGVSDG